MNDTTTGSVEVPDAVVEAAARAHFERWHSESERRWDALPDVYRVDWLDAMRAGLAAVAPHIGTDATGCR